MEILKHTGDNIGGNFKIKIAYTEQVQEIPGTYNGAIHNDVAMKPGGRWFDVYCTEESIDFKDVQSDSDHGDFFNKTVTGFIPKDRADAIEFVEALKNRPIIIDLLDNNEVRKLVGTVEEPMYFKSSFESKDQVSGRAGTTITFSGSGIKRSPIYNI